jgi:hypothetical protein
MSIPWLKFGNPFMFVVKPMSNYHATHRECHFHELNHANFPAFHELADQLPVSAGPVP